LTSTQPDKSLPLKSGSNPEVANMNMARMVLFSEPEENEALSLGVIKALTGDKSINARLNHSNNTNTQLTATFILEVNGKPNINGKINDACCERWININFSNCFTSKTHLIDNITKFAQNTLYKTLDWQMQTRCALFDVLLEFKGNEIIIPKSIESDTMDYLCSNDPLLKWFETTYDFIDTEAGKNDIVKSCDMFDELKQSDFYLNLSKKAKREEYTKKGLINKIKENVKLKPYFFEKEKNFNDGRTFKNYLTNCKRKEHEGEDIEL
jgi:phage/plasmid-associated DNA primase